MVRIADLLQLAEFDQIKVLGGEAGLNREIRSVTVHDAPYSVNWLRGHEIVLSTGFHIRSGSMEVDDWLNILADRRISCLALAEDFTRENTECLRTWADRASIPVLAVPPTKRWSDLLEPIGTLLTQENDRHAQQVRMIQDALGRLLQDPFRTLPLDPPEISDLASRIAAVIEFSPEISPEQVRQFGVKMRRQLQSGSGFCAWEGRRVALFFLPNDDGPDSPESLQSWLTHHHCSWPTAAAGIGCSYSDLPEGEPFVHAVRKALAALQFGQMFGVSGPTYTYQSLFAIDWLCQLLCRHTYNAELSRIDQTIGQLMEADDGKELFQTLKAYLESNMNRRECARKLYLHPNTVRYRLKKIENQTGLKLNDSYQSLLLQVLFLRRMFASTIAEGRMGS